jgi:hypothetical protein
MGGVIGLDSVDKFGLPVYGDNYMVWINQRGSNYEVKNQYTDLVPDVVFSEYKNADEDRKREIEDIVFKICREVNELPRNLITEEDGVSKETSKNIISRMLSPLASQVTNKVTGIGSSYDGRDFGLNPVGVDYLYSFFPNIWDVTKKSAPMSVREGFYNDEKLKKAIKKTLTYSDSMLDLIKWLRMAGLGYCVNFRPASAKALYEAFAPDNAKVYDFAGGYGARCLGAFFAENVREYVGVDVNTETVKNTHKLQDSLLKSEFYNQKKKLKTYLCGSEEFLQKYPEYRGYFDLSFSSPQYFNTEIYSKEETQSCHRYPKYKVWLRDFYRPTIHNAIDVLKRDGVFIINIFEKLPPESGMGTDAKLDLKELTKHCAMEKGFYLYKCDRYLLRTMPGAGKRKEDGTYEKRDRSIGTNFEAVWVFRHYEVLWEEGLISKEDYLKYKDRDKNK